ncbi:fatty acid desaturase family protein, partial [Saprospiraceae bacterium]|nr:fatty acid desaturase family protein [Saprospiraceae bacterium]
NTQHTLLTDWNFILCKVRVMRQSAIESHVKKLVTMIILKLVILVLLADLITGFVHFLLDQYGSPDSRFFKNAIKINLSHHDNPRLMLERTYWELTKDSWKIAFTVMPISILLFGFHWELAFLLVVGANTNIIHRWSHSKKTEKPRFVTFLQQIRVFQGKHQHSQHHKRPFDTYFCIITNFWNPILERIYFWEGVIRFFKLFGIKPVAGTEIRGNL